MNYIDIQTYLQTNIDLKYRAFQQKLTPNTNVQFLGVRLPVIQALAKDIAKGDYQAYLTFVFANTAESFDTYEEAMLCGLVIGNIKADFDFVYQYIKSFVPYIDNWGVCDSFCSSLKIAKQNKGRILELIKEYLQSDKEYELRFAVIMLMDYYIEHEYIDYVLDVFNTIHHDGYYVKMAVAWGLSVCYVKYPIKTTALFENNKLDNFTYNKALQKTIESNRVSSDDKVILKLMKRKV